MASPKSTPKPVAKPRVSPGARAAALQQKAASASFKQASAKRAEIARRAAITKPMGAKFSGSHPTPAPMGKGYQPAKSGASAPKQMNPLQKMLTPGSGTVEGGMKTGTMKDNPLKRILGGK